MSELYGSGPPWPWRAGALLALLAAGAVLALVVAYWGWRWFGPAAPAALAERRRDAPAQEIIAAAPFGRSTTPAQPSNGGPAAAMGGSLPGDTRLLGVFAGAAGSGYALLRLPGHGVILVHSGQEIVSGVKLEAVRPDGIRVRDRGDARDLLLRANQPVVAAPGAMGVKPISGPTSAPASALATPARAACMPPPGFAGPVYRLNAELLSGMAAQPQSWVALLTPGRNGLVVREENGLAAMLGMKAGDSFVQANGIALTAIDDVLAAVVKPLVASQAVRVSGTRDGKPREWLFLNAGACPT